ncbi:MAG: hypothetical protein AB9873_09365 [Syntrophobacteraceae bacterium]
MNEIRKADSGARRNALLMLIGSCLIGALLLAVFQHYRLPLRDWILADPTAVAERARLVLLSLTVLISVPLLGFAAYLWSLGGRVQQAGEFPPPGFRVLRDTEVLTGGAAASKARLLRGLALILALASMGMGVLLWRFASLVYMGRL